MQSPCLGQDMLLAPRGAQALLGEGQPIYAQRRLPPRLQRHFGGVVLCIQWRGGLQLLRRGPRVCRRNRNPEFYPGPRHIGPRQYLHEAVVPCERGARSTTAELLHKLPGAGGALALHSWRINCIGLHRKKRSAWSSASSCRVRQCSQLRNC